MTLDSDDDDDDDDKACLVISKQSYECPHGRQTTNRISVQCVTKNASANPATCSYIKVMYTATEDLITVLNANIQLKHCVRVHTGAKPYSHRHCSEWFTHFGQLEIHCWSHTMKVLGWHVTSVRSSAAVVTWRDIYVDMKVWSRMFAVMSKAFLYRSKFGLVKSHTKLWTCSLR